MEEADYIWMEGELKEWENAKVHALTHALHYGTAVFEGIRAYSTEEKIPAVFRLKEHLERFVDSAEICGFDMDYTEEQLVSAVEKTIQENSLNSCYIRPLAYKSYGEMGLNPLDNSTDVLIAVWPWGAYLGEDGVLEGVDVTTSSWTRHHPNIMPTKAKASGNYLNSVLAKQEAVKNGYDEAVMLDSRGFVAEGTGENLFIKRDGKIITPPETSILEGITRKSVIELLEENGYEVAEENITRDQLYTAEEAFFTGTAAEVVPISTVDDREVTEKVEGSVAKEIREKFMEVVSGKNKQHRDWLHLVK